VTLPQGARLGPYEIVALIGAGGMGEVYKARDTRLNRTVAIKVLGAGVGGDPTMRRRLLREARSASALNHPHICTIYDVGEDDERQFIAMEWLEGETLNARLGRLPDGILPLDELLRYALQLADALDAAHATGIVHRDLKPANLWITRRGDAKILDFGLAKIVAPHDGGETPTTAPDLRLTEMGSAVGTDAYMAPEQARGEPVDARSDLFSLGAVLYEMATGRQVFARATAALTFDAILNRDPPSPGTVNADLSPGVAQIIMRLLAKRPDARYQRARDVMEAVRALTPGSSPRGSSVAGPPSIAVLPFANLSPDPENEYFADGMTEEIINALAHVAGLRVAARTSSFAFKGKTPDVPAVAASLNVAHILTGSLRKAGQRLRITVQLVDASTGFPVWSERYDRQADDVFRIQDEIAAVIASKLRVTLTGSDDQTRIRRPTDNLEAYELYLKGRFLLNQRGGELVRGLAWLERVIALDPKFALAHAGLGDAYALLGFYGYMPSYEAMPRARRSAQIAIDLDPTLAEPHGTLMFVSWTYDWDWDRTRVEFERAMALNPRLPNTLQWHATYLGLVEGSFEPAVAEARRAIDLDPLSGSAHAVLGTLWLCDGKYGDAQTSLNRAIELDPRLWVAHRSLGLTFMQQQRYDEALAIFDDALALSKRHPWILSYVAEIYRRAGRAADAEALYVEMTSRARTIYIQPLFRAYMSAATGRIDEAFEWLERAYRERNSIPPMNYFASSKPLTDDPRFPGLLARTGVTLSPAHRKGRS
jgi:serine/threonine protein kinase/Tfp pilus assembly protein PilF